MKPVGITANLEKPQTREVINALLRRLSFHKETVLFERGVAGHLDKMGGFEIGELARRCRMIFVLGGDGTVLQTAAGVHPHKVPLCPINMGRLGFLASISPSDLDQVLPRMLSGKGKSLLHSTLEIRVLKSGKLGKRMIALNDAVISRGAVSRTAELELWIDGEKLNSYICDGIIFSTPTGSTAYSLSAGGPIVVPKARVFAVTPICAHTLSNRSVIVQDRTMIETRIIRRTDELFLRLDGQRMIRLSSEDRVRVTVGKYQVQTLAAPENSFFELLRKKLHWSGAAPGSLEGI